MSFYDDASIVLIPSGYKESKLYSAKPTDGSGDLAFTRTGSTATRVNSEGLIEKCTTNLVTYSDQFDDPAWVKNSALINPNDTTSPDGNNNADKLIESTTTSGHFLTQSPTITATSYTFSVFAKADERNWFLFRQHTLGLNASFNLSTGTIGTVQSGLSAIIENYGSGWYRCSVTFTGTAAAHTLRLYVTTADNSTSSYLGDGSSGLYLYGAQLEIGDIATEYIPTTTAAVTVGPVANLPRLDYTGGGCPKLLMEPTRTNLALYSKQFDNAYWTKLNSSTLTANTSGSPSGFQDADKFQASSLAFGGILRRTITVTSDTAYTFSFFCKKDNYRYVGIRFNTSTIGGLIIPTYDFDTNTFYAQGVAGVTLASQLYANGWVRLILTYTSTTTVGTSDICIVPANGDTGTALTGTESILIYGAQLEAGSYATSYIPTWNASVTRNQDSFVKTGISSLLGQTEGTIFLELIANRTGASQNIEISDGTITNRIDLRLNAANAYQLVIVQGGVVVFNETSAATFAQGERIKLAAAYKSDELTNLYVNGVSVLSNTSGAITGNLTGIYSASIGGATDPIYSPINQIQVYKTRLSNDDLATLTTL